jgi:ubiquinone/menaquinone biosynthesis C-methylase UbiE
MKRSRLEPAARSTSVIFALVLLLAPVGRAEEPRAPAETDEAVDREESTERPSGGRRYAFRGRQSPDGIGKIYMGREIAKVMSFHGAPWLERPTRDQEENLTALVEALQLEPGMVVTDIGAGTGVISVMMAEKVAPSGKVLAVDIQEEMLSLLSKKLKQLGVENVQPVLGTIKSPELEPESVDLALFVDVYHEFSFPYEMMLEISKALKPGGRAVFVEYRKEDPRVPIKPLHKMSEAQVKKEMGQREFRLRWKETIDVLPRQHIIVFEKLRESESPEGS